MSNQSKVMDLRDAVKKYVTNGSHICIGGMTIGRNPMAAVYETIRLGIKDLHIYVHSNGQGLDELIGCNCISMLEVAYGGTGRAAPTGIRFKRAIQKAEIQYEDYTNFQIALRFLAGAMGVPFLPTRSGLGTDIVEKWGFSRDVREKDPKIPNEKLIVADNPFTNWGYPKVVLLPAINPDVALLHVQKADKYGTCRITGALYADIEQTKASKNVIVTCEELVDTEELRESPNQNQIPGIHVTAVVHLPYGAYPTACFGHYDYDPIYLKEYAKYAKNDQLYREYVDKYIYGVRDHEDFLKLIGAERLQLIKADPEKGYAVNLDRR
jgi:glutaconate CoA-transferase, subunit A